MEEISESVLPKQQDDLFIAGALRASDWRKRKELLLSDAADDLWAKTFEEFFRQRLLLRYLKPINLLKAGGEWDGEGFSIVTIQCALIEFLAATIFGENYRCLKDKELGKYEYNKSSEIFKKFLTQYEPFKGWFKNQPGAGVFYKNIRCALLHEARTTGGWKIWASAGPAIDFSRKIVRRDALQVGIEEYITEYGLALTSDKATQDAFIRKFDDLATG